MGKKTQPKGRNPRKAIQRTAAGSVQSTSKIDVGDDTVVSAEGCAHYTRGSDEMNRILLGIRSSVDIIASCEHCRNEPVSKRGNKEKGKQQKKKGSARASEAKPEPNPIWVCLDCNRYFCGGAVKETEPYGHARRHAKQDGHHWAVRFDNPHICWCFSCNLLVLIEVPEQVDGDVKHVKDVQAGILGGNAGQGKGTESGGHPSPESLKGHTIRGLMNLGNTCFFNSVLQNLFAIGMLRDCLAGLERPLGPLTMALKKLFVETSGAADSKSILSPKALFGSICAKAPQFRGYQQQDSHELLRYLLDGLYVEETSAKKVLPDEQNKAVLHPHSTFVEVIFGGQLSSSVSCIECGHKSVVHEPYLDLSLPLPSKKSPAKKVNPSLPKRNKPPLKERGRGRRFQEKGTAKGTTRNEHRIVENDTSLSDCPQTCAPASEPKLIVAAKVEEDSSWMDYLGPGMMLESADSMSQTSEIENAAAKQGHESSWVDSVGVSTTPVNADIACETPKVEDDSSWMDNVGPSTMPDVADSISQCSGRGQMAQVEVNRQGVSNSGIEGCPEEPMVSSDSFKESSCRGEIPSPCIQDSSVILLPYKEADPTVKEITGTTSFYNHTENLSSTDASVIQSSMQSAPTAGCEQAEEDFDGFGDLFNEPEVTSEFTGTSRLEETDVTVGACSSSESYQDEIDNCNTPVSIDSCLALFTKPELLLSDEHGWHCERCSEISSHHNARHKEDKWHAVGRLGQPVELKSHMDGGGIRSKTALPGSEVDRGGFAESNVSDDAKLTFNSMKLCSHSEEPENPRTGVNKSLDPLSLVGGSGQMRQQNTDACNGENRSGDSRCSEGVQCSNLTLKDNNIEDVSIPAVYEKTLSPVRSGKEDRSSCGLNDSTSVPCVGQVMAAISVSSADRSKVILPNSCEKDYFNSQVQKKGSQLHEVCPSNDSVGVEIKPKRRMVKRDATKRILVSKAPPILTVHLKRFGQDARGRLNKLRGHVSFQETLDLRPFMDPWCVDKERCFYRLVGVVEHSGNMTGGHYVAYVRGDKKDGGQKSDRTAWFYASDSHIRETSLSEVLKCEAYILFYERV